MRVVATGAVRTREAEVELLLVVGAPRQVELALADVHDRGPVPGQAGRDLGRLVGGPTGHEEHPVGAESARHPGQERLSTAARPSSSGAAHKHRAGLLGQPAALGHDVEADHLHARGHEQAHDELAHQAQADDTGGVADLGVALAHALHGDGADGGEGGEARASTASGTATQRLVGTQLQLGVKGELVAGAGDDLARENSSAPAPTSTTTPASEYPSGV